VEKALGPGRGRKERSQVLVACYSRKIHLFHRAKKKHKKSGKTEEIGIKQNEYLPKEEVTSKRV